MQLSNLMPTEIQTLGTSFMQSGMFPDLKSAAQAIVKIQAGQELGIPPFASMSGIHIIQGKPTIGAGLMAAAVKRNGKYDYKVIEQTEKVCSIDFYQGKEKIGNSTFTIQDATKAGTKNIDKFPRNMLFARAISNGVKWYCPDIFAGPVYVPEEMENITEDVKHEEVPPVAPLQPAGATKKPLNAISFKSAVKRLKEGEIELLDKLIETYSITPEQRASIDAAWDEGCKVKDGIPEPAEKLPF